MKQPDYIKNKQLLNKKKTNVSSASAMFIFKGNTLINLNKQIFLFSHFIFEKYYKIAFDNPNVAVIKPLLNFNNNYQF